MRAQTKLHMGQTGGSVTSAIALYDRVQRSWCTELNCSRRCAIRGSPVRSRAIVSITHSRHGSIDLARSGG